MTRSIWIKPQTVYDETSQSNQRMRRTIAIVSNIKEIFKNKLPTDYMSKKYEFNQESKYDD